MKYDYNIVSSKNRVEIQISEGFDSDQWMKYTMILFEDPDFKQGMDTLCELRLPDEHDTTIAVLKKVEEMLQGMLNYDTAGAKVAIVVKNIGEQEAVEMFKVVVERLPIKIEVFYDVDEANEWLDQ